MYSAKTWERNRSLTQEDFESLTTELFADEGSETGSAPAVDGGTSAMNDPALDHAGSYLPMQAEVSLSDHGSGDAVPSDTTTAAPVQNEFHFVPPYVVDHDGVSEEIVERRRNALAAMTDGDQHAVDQIIGSDYEAMLSTLLDACVLFLSLVRWKFTTRQTTTKFSSGF